MRTFELLENKKRIMCELFNIAEGVSDLGSTDKFDFDSDIPIFLEYVQLLERCVAPEYLQISWNLIKFDMVIHSDDWQDGDEETVVPCERTFHKGFTAEEITKSLQEHAQQLLSFMGSEFKVYIKIKSITETNERPSKITISMAKGIWDWETYPTDHILK